MPGKIKFFSALAVFLAFHLSSFPQFQPGSLANGVLPRVIPSSPEASSLGKYGEWPVSQYTGVPNISVPIYEVKVGDIKVPITVSYHAGGVKIDDVSAWVSTNWTLNAGGAITRSIVGLGDEETSGGFLYRSQRNDGLKSTYDVTNSADYVFFRKVSDRLIDVEPDLFFYNFCGNSGKFYFDETGTLQCIPVNTIKLIRSSVNNTLIYSNDEHWELADENGTVYHFGSYQEGGNGLEATEVWNGAPSISERRRSAWYLTKIISANQADTIYFDYADKYETYELPGTQSLKVLTNDLAPFMPSGGSWTNVLKLDQIVINGNGLPNQFTSNGKAMLQKIRWRNGEVVFTAATNRQDIVGKLLTKVTVVDRSLKTLKEIQLKYSYLNSRYYLDSLIEVGVNQERRAHSFEYIQPASLPVRNSAGFNSSFAQDHWGYYNGANSNTHLLPPQTTVNSPGLNANRESNEAYMQYGSLKKVNYPTGGYTEFVYEAHRYDPASPLGGGSPGSQIVSSTVNITAADPQPGGVFRTSTFNIPFTQYNLPLSIQYNNYNKATSKELSFLPLIKIEKLAGSTYHTLYYWDAFDNFPVGNAPPPNQYGFIDFNLTQTLSLEPGDYRISADIVCGSGNCGSPVIKPSVTCQLNYSTYTGQLPIAGGLRIKQINNYTSGSLVSQRQYTYSPGKLLIYPRYTHEYAQDVFELTTCFSNPNCVGNCQHLFAKYKEVTSTSQAILGFTQGASVGYSFVKEMQLDGKGVEEGYTEFDFTFTPDALNAFQIDPGYWPGTDIQNSCVPLNNYEYKRGLLFAKTTFKRNNLGIYKKIHSILNSYQFNDNDSANRFNTLKALRVKRMRIVNYQCGTLYDGYRFPPTALEVRPDIAYAFYSLITSWVQNISTTETYYDENGENPLVKITNYNYSNPQFLQPTSVEVNDSEQKITRTQYKYTYDYTGNPVLGSMAQKNIISPLIEEKIFKVEGTQQKLLSTVFTEYKQIGSLFAQDIIQSALHSNGLETRIRFNSYDARGNILELLKENDIKQSYIWDYNSSYPIAEVINSDVADIAHTSFEADGKGNWNNYTGDIITVSTGSLPPTGNKYYSLTPTATLSKVVTSGQVYIVSYWRNNASPFTINGGSGAHKAGSTVNGWTFHQHKITASSSTITITGTGGIDEVRLYPSGAQMTTYTYEPLVGMTSRCDNNNRITYYHYDGFGRLQTIGDQEGNVLKTYDYRYQQNNNQ
ncbi:MAG: hypothetical protein KF862_25350 [Chitinophagaceae bacterium]|nr:hypothetical protein [Chitinophagaceae bacterium]